MQILTITIGGQAGQGIKSAGLMLAKVATRSGFNIYTYTEYPSLIRGGHNVMQINISPDEVTGPRSQTNFLIALNQDTIDQHFDELTPGSGVLFDKDAELDIAKIKTEVNLFPIPLSDLANKAGGKELMINMVALGANLALFRGDLEILDKLIEEEFTNQGAQIVTVNQKAAKLGFDYTVKTFGNKITDSLKKTVPAKPLMVTNGNDAIAMGAIAAGMQFVAIYPMTPISNMISFLALYQEKYGYIYKQPEDEISAINMAIGASFAGARSMAATSGGGFCLMSEGLGLAGMTETPLVIIEGMRPGPATSMPTWNEQGDLQFVLNAHQGDFPKIVLATGDAKEAFDLTMQAFNLADKYQTPVVLLVDKTICEGDQSFPLFHPDADIDRGKFTTEKIADYQRFALSPDGISLRSIPGTGNFFIANSDEHDPTGFSSEDKDNRVKMMQKRMQKLETCREEMPTLQVFGAKEADLTLLSWGSNKGSILQAIADFKNVNFIHITSMSPFPAEELKNLLENARLIVSIECNYTGQLTRLIREKTGIEIIDQWLKYDGRPFFIEEIKEKINNIIKV